MDGFEILIPLAPFLMVAAIVIIPAWLKSRERREMQATLRTAIEKGQSLPPEVIDALSKDNIKPSSTASRDLRVGIVWLAVGLGIAAFSVLNDFNSWTDNDFGGDIDGSLLGISAIPAFIGLAFIVLSLFNKNKG